ncbi:MAG TPA: ArgE/DapE family deacylase [Chloroflexota bacterium]|nr:ArgE/DapE family deacylase [Chloroflexota bacterium]
MDETTPFESAVLAAIDEQELIATIQTLVRIPSVTGDEAAVQQRFAALMLDAGMTVDLWPLDLQALRADPAYPGEEVERREGWGLVGQWGAGEGPRLILNGHVDVVPPGLLENWTVDPWSGDLRDGRIYGRGACDMKGGLASAFCALRAVQRAGLTLRGSVTLQSVVSEEDGGLGTLAAIRRGYVGDAAVIVEPTELALIPAQAGALGFALRVPGRSAHACVRLEGTSAIEKFVPLFQALQDLERRRNTAVTHPLLSQYALPYPLSIGLLRAGNWSSSVPEELEAHGRYGVAMGEDLQEARAALEAAIAEAAATDDWLHVHPPRVIWTGGQFAPGETAGDHPIVQLLGACVRDATGVTPPLQGATYGSDLRLLVNEAHIPSVLFGPGGDRTAHMPDEHIAVAQALAATRALALLIVRYCGVAPQ